MPWKEKTIMEQRVEFIHEWLSDQYSIAELCRAYGISRPTAYKLINKFEQCGFEGLRDYSKAPINHPNKTSSIIEKSIIELRKAHPLWGARKFHKLLEKDYKKDVLPSVMTINNILKRNGLIVPRKRLKRVKPVYPIFDPKECNEVWSADYKGKFLMGNKQYCHPLTICDSKSRYVFTAKGHYHEYFKNVKAEFTKVFKEYGMPDQIHTDNGTPFGYVNAIQRFTRLSYWFIDLGILPVYSDPAHPEQNGRHERMHRDLKAACAMPPASNMSGQQRMLNRFVREYNSVRPHEALDMQTLASIHKCSTKSFPNKIKDYYYPAELTTQYVSKNGSIRWKSYYWIFMALGLAGKHVGIQEIGDGIWKVFYRDVFLGYFDETKIGMKKNKSIRLSKNIV
jgi:transposase InsO family protein